MSGSRLLSLVPLLSVLACGEDPRLEGTVNDCWDQPIAGVTIQIGGQAEQSTTDAKGRFSMPAPTSDVEIRAGKDGFIRGMARVKLAAGDDGALPSPAIQLYPEPAEPGFYAIGRAAYAPMVGATIDTVGTDLKAYTGLKDFGSATVAKSTPVRVVFSSTLRNSELAQLNLQLHKLSFVETAQVPGVLGVSDVKINRWIPDASIAFDLESLPSENDFLITTRGPLEEGTYAFHTQGVLISTDVDALASVPEEMRVAYVFEVR
jgi:hypothetical protein